jgi:hypothetical protein
MTSAYAATQSINSIPCAEFSLADESSELLICKNSKQMNFNNYIESFEKKKNL